VLTKTEQRLSTLEYYRGESLTVARLQELKGNSNKAFYIRAMQKYTDLNIEQVNLLIQVTISPRHLFRPHLQPLPFTNKVFNQHKMQLKALDVPLNPILPHLQSLQFSNKVFNQHLMQLKALDVPWNPILPNFQPLQFSKKVFNQHLMQLNPYVF
jgi:hypothetical protein